MGGSLLRPRRGAAAGRRAPRTQAVQSGRKSDGQGGSAAQPEVAADPSVHPIFEQGRCRGLGRILSGVGPGGTDPSPSRWPAAAGCPCRGPAADLRTIARNDQGAGGLGQRVEVGEGRGWVIRLEGSDQALPTPQMVPGTIPRQRMGLDRPASVSTRKKRSRTASRSAAESGGLAPRRPESSNPGRAARRSRGRWRPEGHRRRVPSGTSGRHGDSGYGAASLLPR